MRQKWSLLVVGLYASACLSTLQQTLPLEFWFQHSISLGSDVFSFHSNQHFQLDEWFDSLRKQLTLRAKCRLRKEHRNSTLITRHYPDLGNASDG